MFSLKWKKTPRPFSRRPLAVLPVEVLDSWTRHLSKKFTNIYPSLLPLEFLLNRAMNCAVLGATTSMRLRATRIEAQLDPFHIGGVWIAHSEASCDTVKSNDRVPRLRAPVDPVP
jgi:hypothetical protein